MKFYQGKDFKTTPLDLSEERATELLVMILKWVDTRVNQGVKAAMAQAIVDTTNLGTEELLFLTTVVTMATEEKSDSNNVLPLGGFSKELLN